MTVPSVLIRIQLISALPVLFFLLTSCQHRTAVERTIFDHDKVRIGDKLDAVEIKVPALITDEITLSPVALARLEEKDEDVTVYFTFCDPSSIPTLDSLRQETEVDVDNMTLSAVFLYYGKEDPRNRVVAADSPNDWKPFFEILDYFAGDEQTADVGMGDDPFGLTPQGAGVGVIDRRVSDGEK